LQNEFEEISKFNSRTFACRGDEILNKLTEFDPIYAKNRSKAQSRVALHRRISGDLQ
jgi:hypothetical protein